MTPRIALLRPLAALCLSALLPAHAGVDPFPDSTAKALAKWRDSRYGMFIHWGPISQKGTEISWSRGDVVPRAVYDTLYKTFNPTGFNPKEWVDLAKAGGMRYVTLITKHHDGFSMFDSKYTDYDIMSTPFGRDVAKELAAECKRQGVRFDTYYSVLDWYQPDWPVPKHGGPGYALPAGQVPSLDRYVTFMKNQLTEIVRGYDPGVMWFDGDWESVWTPDRAADVYGMLKTLKPSMLVNNRIYGSRTKWQSLYPAAAGDFDTPEKKVGAFNDSIPWETNTTIAEQWAYKPNNPLRPLGSYIRELVQVLGGDGNYMLNLGPGPDGRFVPAEAAVARAIGAWVLARPEAIYGTRGGPYLPGEWGGATKNGNKVYLHITDWPLGDRFVFPPMPQRVTAFRRIGGGTVAVDQSAGDLVVRIPKEGRDTLGETVELTLAAAAPRVIRTVVDGAGFSIGSFGQWLSQKSTYALSSEDTGSADKAKLLTGEDFAADKAFQTKLEDNPYLIVDLGQARTVKGLEITNRFDLSKYDYKDKFKYLDRARTLTVWTSLDGKTWQEAWRAEAARMRWAAPLQVAQGSKVVIGRDARYVKIGLRERNVLNLKSVKIYGETEAGQPTSAAAPAPGPSRPSLSWNGGRVTFTLPTAGDVELAAFGASGKRLAVLAAGRREAGTHLLDLPADRIAGLAWLRLTAGRETRVLRLRAGP